MSSRDFITKVWCRAIFKLSVIFTAVFTIGLVSAPASAELVKGLYEGSIIVQSQSAKERKKASRELLSQVLVKVSGSRQIESNEVIRRAVRHPDSYVQQFSYKSQVVNVSDEYISVTPSQQSLTQPLEEKTVYELSLQFNANALEKLLLEANLPLWPNNRPTVLIWLVSKNEDGLRYFVNENDPSGIYDSVLQAANDRGLPVVTPLLDLQDQTQISENDVWGLYHQLIRQASKRYNADTILVGRLDPISDDRWDVTWMFLTNDTTVFDATAMDLNSAIHFGIDRIADNFAEQYAITPNELEQGNILLQVDEVDNFEKYSALASYLEAQAAIKKVTVVQVEKDTIYYRLEVQGNFQQLREAIALDKKLLPKPIAMFADLPASLQASGVKRLRYYWDP